MTGFLELPGRCYHNYPGWGPLKVEVLAAESPEQLTAQANLLIDNPELNVLAVSAATSTAMFCEEPWCMTVVLQEKVDPNGSGSAARDGGQ